MPVATPTVTSYVVLREDDTATWENVDTVNAGSGEAAVRIVAGRPGGADHTYVAVPSRSWKPVKVRAEQKVVLRLEEGDGAEVAPPAPPPTPDVGLPEVGSRA